MWTRGYWGVVARVEGWGGVGEEEEGGRRRRRRRQVRESAF